MLTPEYKIYEIAGELMGTRDSELNVQLMKIRELCGILILKNEEE